MADIGYTLIYEPNTAAKTSINEFKTLLEKSKDDVKINTMKRILITMLNDTFLSYPETRKKTLEEIDMTFQNGISPWRSAEFTIQSLDGDLSDSKENNVTHVEQVESKSISK